MVARTRFQTVAETGVFSRDIDAMLPPNQRDLVIDSIARDPTGGDLIPGAGGLRKRRIALSGRGKRGGARVITLYLGDRLPVYALFVFAKNERADLSSEQRQLLRHLVNDIKAKTRARS
jgi:hypothetical protein